MAKTKLLIAILLILFLSHRDSLAQTKHREALAQDLNHFFEPLARSVEKFGYKGTIEVPIDGKRQPIEVRLERFDRVSFDLQLTHPEYAIEIRRRAEGIAMGLPKHKTVYIGKGDVLPLDNLEPEGLLERIISSGSQAKSYLPAFAQSTPDSLAFLVTTVAQAKFNEEKKNWNVGGDVDFQFVRKESGLALSVDSNDVQVRLERTLSGDSQGLEDWTGYTATQLTRGEMEMQFCRGVRRALEVLLPSDELTQPEKQDKVVTNGSLRWVEGQRVVTLSGTPEQLGTAHGELLPVESQRCIDSVLYAFGTVQTIITGRWFQEDLAKAYARLKPHIPADHIAETRALAMALGQNPDTIEVVNVFPELFHCSGFAVFGSATKDGKLYHGRVLDYMTTIGLQDCATTFIVAPTGKFAFANVGYAGFTGSVSGMNNQGISLGEMGGRGEGKWDGVPMATLMRRALEECDSLEGVIKLWSESPRTCEYYYVFADGKTNEAVGVAATPEKVEFVKPGEGHELLGEGIRDAVVLSAGNRLATLRQRVTENHGKIDVEKAQWLMSRPVAMSSNLHNVLFVPEDGILYVANADHKRPAAERPYVKIDLRGLLAKEVEANKAP